MQADYRGRLRAILEKELEDLDRRATLPVVARPELNEIDLSGVPEPPARRAAAAAVEPELIEPEPIEPEIVEPAEPAARTVPPLGASSMFARPPGDADGGPPTEALVVLDEELADTGPSGRNARRRA